MAVYRLSMIRKRDNLTIFLAPNSDGHIINLEGNIVTRDCTIKIIEAEADFLNKTLIDKK